MLQSSVAAVVTGMIFPQQTQAKEPLLDYFGKPIGHWLEIISNIKEVDYNYTGADHVYKIGFAYIPKEHAQCRYPWHDKGCRFWGKVLVTETQRLQRPKKWATPSLTIERIDASEYEFFKR